jgi:hypothetical protein
VLYIGGACRCFAPLCVSAGMHTCWMHLCVHTDVNSTRFLELIIDSSLSRKDHITELTSKLNKACYTIRAIKPFMSLDAMKMIYYSYVHSVILYGIIFWGSSHLSGSIFKIQKE